MSEPSIIQPNARCPYCTTAFYISKKATYVSAISCNKCNSYFDPREAWLKQEKKK